MINGHGDDSFKYQNKVVHDFSSNVWYKGTPTSLINYLKEDMASIGHYPEPMAETLIKAFDKYFAMPEGSCLATNGSAEAFYCIAEAFGGASSTIVIPAFAEYEDACKLKKHKVKVVSNNTLNKHSVFHTDMVWLGNPNNPDGKLFAPATIEAWLRNNPHTTFVVDEAYIDLCDQHSSCIQLITPKSKLIITRSFTKSYAIPGLRLGLILASQKVIQHLSTFLIPWSVNSLAQKAGHYIIEHPAHTLVDKAEMRDLRHHLCHELSQLPEVSFCQSTTNYVLIHTPCCLASELKEYLVEQHGLLIRDASNFRGLTPHHWRVAVQSKSTNSILVSAFKNYLNSIKK